MSSINVESVTIDLEEYMRLVALEKEIKILRAEIENIDQKRRINYNMYLDSQRKLKRYRAMIKGELMAKYGPACM